MILDATFLVDLARGDPGARAFLEEAERGSEAVRVAAPALAKLGEALERSRHPPRQRERLVATLLAAPEAPFTARHAVAAGRILAEATRVEWPLDPFDAMTAAIAVVDEEALVTRNARDFERVADLRVRSY